ncbi:hypothetical protein FACS189430_05020 [Bacteroidia bacterium]|nr:hypothetical protein FACS189430_05020 [Bacteroidia bacterium]
MIKLRASVLTVIVLLAATAGVSSCKKKNNDDPQEPAKSAACDITSFKVGNDTWQISGTSITYQYPKGTAPGSLTPTITVSDKASVNPASDVSQSDFFTTNGVTYTVTAEDGVTKKTYTAKASVATAQ